jgi:hypothetical protein
MSDQQVERGAQEEASGTPLTETEERASERPPSVGDAQSLAEDDPGDATAGADSDASGGPAA